MPEQAPFDCPNCESSQVYREPESEWYKCRSCEYTMIEEDNALWVRHD